MLAAAFPRLSWSDENEAIYAMSLAAAGIDPVVARAAVAELVREEQYLPTIATVLNRCYTLRANETLASVSCPSCGSYLVAYERGSCLCFDCDHEWVTP